MNSPSKLESNRNGSNGFRIAPVLATTCFASFVLAPGAFAVDRYWIDDFDNWSVASRWSPNGVPGVNDHVIVGAAPGPLNGIVNMDVNGIIAELSVLGTSHLDTEGWWLNVSGPARIDGNGSGGSESNYARLRVTNGAGPIDFRADSLLVGSEGKLLLTNQPSIDIDGAITVSADGLFFGSGNVTAGGNFSNSGEIQAFGGDLSIDLGGNSLDLDGSGPGELVINDAGTDVTISAQGLTDAFDGYLFLGGGSVLDMSLNNPWALGPNSTVSVAWIQSQGHFSTIQGAPLTIAGNVTAICRGNTLRIEAPVTVAPAALIDFFEIGADASNTILFNNTATIDGGLFEISDAARIEFNDDTVVSDGTFILGEGAALAFDGATTINGGDFATFSEDATDGAILFNGPTTWDGTVFILGIARQMGNATVTGQTTINATVFDMDGGPANWNINSGLTIHANAIDELSLPNAFNTQMTLGSAIACRLTVVLPGSTSWQMNGQMTINGQPVLYTTRIAGSPVRMGGAVTLTGGFAHIDADLTLANGSTTTIPAGAGLRGGRITQIQPTASFSGSGTLRNHTTGIMNLQSGVSLGNVGLSNDGTFLLENVPAIASVGRFESSDNGDFHVNIAGYAAGTEHDQLVVSPGPAVIGGNLYVNHYDTGGAVFQPNIGDEFTIITAVGGVSGSFSGNPTSCAAGKAFRWTVLYGANDVRLRLDSIGDCCAADLDQDGVISLSDLAVLLSNFGTPMAATQSMGDIDSDGDVDLQDMALLLAQFGTNC